MGIGFHPPVSLRHAQVPLSWDPGRHPFNRPLGCDFEGDLHGGAFPASPSWPSMHASDIITLRCHCALGMPIRAH